jgi:hypothetical protein
MAPFPNQVFYLLLHCTIFAVGEKRRLKMKMNLLTRMFLKPVSRQQREMAYLNESVSIYDLESREREVSRGKFRGY